MKKRMVIIGLLIIAVIGVIYFFIPAKEDFSYESTVNCTEEAATRYLVNKNKWQQWWPGEKKAEHLYSYKNCEYRITKLLLNGFEVTISNKTDSVAGSLHMLPGDQHSVQLTWVASFARPENFFSRISTYLHQREIRNNIQSLMQDIKKFFDEEKNVYGFSAAVQKVTDEFLITVKQPLNHYPSMSEVYDIINEIKTYISRQGGKEKNPPMLNVYKEGPDAYQLMVAIPTTGQLPGEGKFLFRQMVLGNILVAEVKGGIYSITKAETEMSNYITDHQKSSPAMPYQSLITNRMAEADTAKWITRLYYPVYY